MCLCMMQLCAVCFKCDMECLCGNQQQRWMQTWVSKVHLFATYQTVHRRDVLEDSIAPRKMSIVQSTTEPHKGAVRGCIHQLQRIDTKSIPNSPVYSPIERISSVTAGVFLLALIHSISDQEYVVPISVCLLTCCNDGQVTPQSSPLERVAPASLLCLD